MPLPKPMKPTLRRLSSSEADARDELRRAAFNKALFDAMMKEASEG